MFSYIWRTRFVGHGNSALQYCFNPRVAFNNQLDLLAIWILHLAIIGILMIFKLIVQT